MVSTACSSTGIRQARPSLTALSRDGAAEDRAGCVTDPFLTHRLGDTRHDAVDDGEGRFRRYVARGEAGAAGGEDDVQRALVGPLTEVGGDLVDLIGHDGMALHHGVDGREHLLDGRAAGVVAPAAGGLVADGEDRYANGHPIPSQQAIILACAPGQGKAPARFRKNAHKPAPKTLDNRANCGKMWRVVGKSG